MKGGQEDRWEGWKGGAEQRETSSTCSTAQDEQRRDRTPRVSPAQALQFAPSQTRTRSRRGKRRRNTKRKKKKNRKKNKKDSHASPSNSHASPNTHKRPTAPSSHTSRYNATSYGTPRPASTASSTPGGLLAQRALRDGHGAGEDGCG